MEQSLSSLTYKGSIPAAIAEAKKQRKLFVVYISGVDAESSRLGSSTWSDSMVAESILKYCVLLHLSEGSNDATQFSAIYPQKSIPCITAVGYNGVQLWQNEGFISAEVLASSLEKVWLSLHLQDTTAAVLSAALASKTSEPSTSGVSTTASSDQGSSDVGGQSPLTDRYGKSPDAITEVSPDKVKEHKSDACTAEDTTAAVLSAELASKTSEPSTSGVSTTASSDQGSSDVGSQSPLTDRFGKSPDAITEVSPDKVKEHKSDACTAEEKSFECGGVKTSSTSVDANEAGCASTDFSIEATKELPRSTVVDLDNTALLDGPHSPEKISTDSNLVVSGGGSKSMNTEVNQVERGANNEDEADKRVNRVNKSNDVYLNIRMPDGVNLQEKFSVTSTLRLVKDYIDEHHEGVIGSYDLAIPYPRNVYSDQDLSRTLSELGLFDRQALIVVPRQRTTDQSNSRNIADSSNESNEGYFACLKRLFSFINPLSYLGGGSSSTSSGQQSQHGPISTLQNNFTQEQRPQNISSSSGNDGKNRRQTTSRSGSNIHTLKHDEDDGRFNDRNSFWNGNSTQYGGNDDGK